jgi:Predicted transmembrane transcriptional regulator (anti-sigma factor)
MNCEMANNYMMKYFDGEVNDIEDAQFRQHLKSCERCRQEYECMDEIFSTLECPVIVEPPDNFEANVMEKVNEIEKKRMDRRTRLLVILYNAAAILAIGLLMVFVVGMRPGGLASAIDSVNGYFGSFNSVTSAVFGIVGDIFKLLGGVLMTILQVFISIVKTYYYVFVTMIVLLLAIQRLYNFVAVHDGRKS